MSSVAKGEVGRYNKHIFYVYLIKLSNDDFYVGSTQDLGKRLKKHQNGEVPHTSKFRPHKLAWYVAFQDGSLATGFEKYLKSSSGKAFRNKHLI